MRIIVFTSALTFIFFRISSARAEVNTFSSSPVSAKIYFAVPSENLILTSRDDGTTVDIGPNTRSVVGLSISIRDFMTLSVATVGAESSASVSQYGSTSFTDEKLSLVLGRSWLFEGEYGAYKGFYISNTPTVSPTSSGNILLANLQCNFGRAALTYIFSPDSFSLAGALDQSQRQSKSGGTFLLGINTGLVSIANAGTAIIPSSVQSHYGNDATLSSAQFTSFDFTFGYGYTLLFSDKIFATLLGSVGYGKQSGTWTDAATDDKNWQTISYDDIKLALGYNGDSFFTTFAAETYSTDYFTSDITIEHSVESVGLSLGHRF